MVKWATEKRATGKKGNGKSGNQFTVNATGRIYLKESTRFKVVVDNKQTYA